MNYKGYGRKLSWRCWLRIFPEKERKTAEDMTREIYDLRAET
jgi:hypothetical protein